MRPKYTRRKSGSDHEQGYVVPGAIANPENAEKLQEPQQKASLESLIPWDRVGESAEVAACASLLASDEASYVTGATLFVDGGMSLPASRRARDRAYAGFVGYSGASS